MCSGVCLEKEVASVSDETVLIDIGGEWEEVVMTEEYDCCSVSNN